MTDNHYNNLVSAKKLGLTILLNLSISIAQLIGGFLTSSMALMSDAIHNFADVASLFISYFANRLSTKNATLRRTYGFRRSEIVAAFVNSAILIVISSIIIIKSIERVWIPNNINGKWVIYLALFGIFVNGVSVLLIKADAKQNINIGAAFLHLLSDLLTSVGVLISGIFIYYLNWWWIDIVISLIIAVYISFESIKIFLNALSIIMQFSPPSLDIQMIIKEIEQIDDIENIHHIHIWQISDKEIIFEAHIDLKKDLKISQTEDILSQIRKITAKYNINHTAIQIELNSCQDKSKIKEFEQ